MTYSPATLRLAGLLYLAIIVCGISAEVLFRGPLVDFDDPSATVSTINNAIGTFRLAIAADIVMATADAALAILLYVIFRSVAPVLALAAMVFRLIQSVIIAMNLMHLQSALLLITGTPDLATEHAAAMAVHALNLHAHGYDLGLVFFAINSLLTGILIWVSGLFPRIVGVGIALAGIVYLLGSSLRFFAPALFEAFTPAYGMTVLAESAFCLVLLSGWTKHRRITDQGRL